MNRTKKVLSGILAALMLVSMLAIFVLPAGAAETQTDYIVSTAADWNKLANDTGIDWTGKTIHIQNDISFASKNQAGEITSYIAPVQFGTFAGTLDGHGYKFTDIQVSGSAINSASLITLLTGTIQNLTLDSTCSFTNTYSSVKSGAFAAESNGGTIYNCASYATYTATGGNHLGGFVGTANNGLIIDGCIFGGTVSANSGPANAFVGYNNGTKPLKVCNSIAMGTVQSGGVVNAANTGMIRVHSSMVRASALASNALIYNSYAVGMNVANYNGADDLNEADGENFENLHSMEDCIEAAWTINGNHHAGSGKEQVWFNMDINGNLCRGDAENRVVRLTTIKPDSTTYSFHGPRAKAMTKTTAKDENDQTINVLATCSTVAQTTIIPETIDGYTAVVSGAEYSTGIVWVTVDHKYTGKVIYVDTRDIELKYVPNATYELDQAKKQLTELVNAYRAMNPNYFTNWADKQAWLDGAAAVLADESATANELKAQITAEGKLADGVKEMAYPNYPSVSEYNTYKCIASIKDYAVSSKEDWLAAVEMSNYASNPDAVNFKGATLHLTANINMGKTAMLPLCYSGIFDGMLDGHDFVFQNINIDINGAYGPVGLIGVIGATEARWIKNVGIESGEVHVYGTPRYKALLMEITDAGNKGAAILGKTHKNGTVIRKCWNNANVTVGNRDSAACIVADPRNYAVVDSCFNLGQSSAHGIQGYGRQVAKVMNSFTGIVDDAAVLFTSGLLANKDYSLATQLQNVIGVKKTLVFNHLSSDAAEKAAQVAAQDAYNEEAAHSALSDAEAAWKVNKNYVDSGYGDRVYFTLNENDEVRFGTAENQIRRIELVCGEQVQYAYAAAGSTMALNFDVQANYYACSDENVKIKDNTITIGNQDVTVYVGYDADRGNVNGDAQHTINILDVLDALRMSVNVVAADKLTADVDNDYDVDIRDAYHLIRYWIDGESDVFTPGLPKENKNTDYIKVLSYNIKSFHYDPHTPSDYNNGNNMCRTESVLNEIKMIDADIMGFQEVDQFSAGSNYLDELQMIVDAMKTVHPENQYYYKFFRTVPDKADPTKTTDGYGHGIVTKYAILDFGGEHFADKVQMAEDTPGQKLDGSEPRGFAWYKLDIDGNGRYNAEKDIVFYNCHLANFTAPQLRYMTEYMKQHHNGERIVCTGDFNLNAWMADGAFDKNAFTVLNGGKNFDSFIRTAISGSMIDNILVSNNVEYFTSTGSAAYGTISGNGAVTAQRNLYGLQPGTAYKDVDYTGKEWGASDHLPIWAYIKK